MWIVTVENQGDKGSKFAGVSESICVTTPVGKKNTPYGAKYALAMSRRSPLIAVTPMDPRANGA